MDRIVKGSPIKPMPTWIMVAGIAGAAIIVFLGYGCYLGSTPEGKDRAKLRHMFEYCKAEEEKAKEDPTTRGASDLAHQTCEKIKADYRQKWGRDP